MDTAVQPVVRVQTVRLLGGEGIGRFIAWFPNERHAFFNSAAEGSALICAYFGDSEFEVKAPIEFMTDMTVVGLNEIEIAEEKGRALR